MPSLDPTLASALAVALSYLLGSIPWGLVLTKLVKGVDLRQIGSGNIGATNAMRAAGKPVGLLVFALDLLKGWAAVALCAGALAGAGPLTSLAIACGAASVLGHCFPVWLGFKGGKGVATGCGALLAVDPLIWVVGGVAWLVVLGLTRYVGLASVAMGVAFPIAAWWRTGAASPWPTVGASLLALLILVRHRSNMRRMLSGQEPKAFQKRARSEAPRA